MPSLLADVVLTHTISEAEVATHTLAVAFNLAPFADPLGPELVTADGVRLTPPSTDRAHTGWRAPNGWLADLGAGTTIAVRMPGFAEADWFADELAVEITRLPACPSVDPDLVDSARAATVRQRWRTSSAPQRALLVRLGPEIQAVPPGPAGHRPAPRPHRLARPQGDRLP